MNGALVERTEKDYREYARRWEAAGCPDPWSWVQTMSSESTKRNARAALVWWHRTQLGVALKLPHVPQTKRVPRAFTDVELARLRDVAPTIHARCRPTLDLLYTTGARVQELCGVELDDVTETHILLRVTKRRPGGLRVERTIPLGPTSREAVAALLALPGGKKNNLIGASQHTVQDWMVQLQGRTGVRTHAHKFRATFATHMLQRGVDVRTVQELMGHAHITTTAMGTAPGSVDS